MKKLLVLFVLLMPSIAFAAGGPVSVILIDVVEIAIYTVGVLIASFIGLAARWIAQRYKLMVPAAWLDTVNSYIDMATSCADEWARNKINNNETVNGNAKLNIAMDFLLKIIGDDKKLVKMTEEQIKKLIEARLGEQRSTRFDMGSIASNELATVTGEPYLMPIGDKTVSLVDTDGSGTLMNLTSDGHAEVRVAGGSFLNIDAFLSSHGWEFRGWKLPAPKPNGFVNTVLVVALSVIGIVALGVALSSCAGITKDGVKQVGKNGVNCMIGELFDRASEIAPSLEENIKAAVDQATGKVNWDQVHTSTDGLKSDAAGCALAMAVDLFSRVRIIDGQGFASLQVDRQSLADGYEAIRKKQFGDRTFVVGER